MSASHQKQIALVTGGGSGIGEATARLLASRGATVIVCGRRAEPLESVAASIRADGGQAETLVLDVSDEAQVTQGIQGIVSRHGQIDLVVNNAMAYSWGAIEETTTEAWRSNFLTTVDGTFWACREAGKHMKPRGTGAIVNVSSICGIFGMPWMAGYSAAKAAVLNFTKAVASEWGPAGIRCNAVIPGVVDTPATAGMLSDEKSRRNTEKLIPLRRVAKAHEVATLIAFLGSDEASYITGACIPVDGGRSAELYTVLEG
jgi:NAD(P)-dependent dehydrogenase (short-subunit alcohol dehydrogenase family)